jgi:SAM-dependent methyltransferase
MLNKIRKKTATARKLLERGGLELLLKHTFTKYVLLPLGSRLGLSALVFLTGNVDFPTSVDGVEVARFNLVLQDRDEFMRLIDEAREIGVKEVLEIGTCRGGTAYLFYKLLGANVTTIDVRPLLFTRAVLPLVSRGKIRVIRGDSHSMKTLEKVSNKKYDLLFIDGDHSYDGVKRDYEMYSRLVRPGGLIAFHDIYSPGVAKFWNEVKHGHIYIEIINKSRNSSPGIGVLKL